MSIYSYKKEKILQMQITILPEDLIRRCVWDNYVYYIVGSEKEAEKILLENKETQISERDALVIGLLDAIPSLRWIPFDKSGHNPAPNET